MKTASILILALLLTTPLCAQSAKNKEIDAKVSAGKVQRLRGQNVKAKALFESALRLSTVQTKAAPTSFNLEKRAQIFALLGREKEADADWTRAINLELAERRKPFMPSAQFNVGAPPDLGKHNARLVKLYLTRAQSRQNRGETSLALEDFQAVLRLDAENEGAKKGVEELAPKVEATAAPA